MDPTTTRRPRARRPARALAIAAAALLLPALAGCSGDDGAAADSATCPDGRIRFGIEPFEDPAKLTPAYETLAKGLEEKLDCPVEVTVVEDYAAEVLAMRNDQLELGQFGPLGYVFAKERADAEPLVSFGTAEGEHSSYRAGIWVPKDSSITSVGDLKGRSLALGSVGSTSGDVLPRSALADAKIPEDDVRLDYAGGHPEALLALANGKVDAAQINTQQLAVATEAGHFDEADFRRVWESEDIPNDPITVRGNADPEFKKAVRTALLDLDPKVIGEVGAYLDVTPPGPLLAVDDETYSPLFELAEKMDLTEEDV
ncbi:phosphonate transport system substrate-binding protein [Murinocardiopsis flavida]|uniref:Phosphonate transport system substrate-binding protein n=1 Tax=Murinocardiopsis flavida TaxID=645275 RepID=A0A2P8DI91_9ACTN|nr:phosphate/phosphite/phosphonate ABC transporter substrate-binding protein [Murinocardiopsis flavida]PSK96901.1 phosphonate transport system substrate-binding protein [Murinocardiopsis flavida]